MKPDIPPVILATRGTPLTRHTEIIAAWQNVGMTENAVNTAETSAVPPATSAETSAVSPAIHAANRPLGTPLGKHPTRVLFLGAGELGKEVTHRTHATGRMGVRCRLLRRRSGPAGGA